MSAARSPHVTVIAIGAAGPFGDETWDLDLRGPLDPAALGQVLCGLVPGTGWQLQVLRHGPDHHTLHLAATSPGAEAAEAARIIGLLTDLPAAARPPTPAQAPDAALDAAPAPAPDAAPAPAPQAGHPDQAGHADEARYAGQAGHAYEARLVDLPPAPDAAAVRAALRAVLSARPHLHAPREEVLSEGEFTSEAGFAAAVDALGRTLAARHDLPLRALLARDRRRGPRRDRLALIAREHTVDAAAWPGLLHEVAAALESRAPHAAPARPGRPAPAPPPPAAALRELARDPAEARHWAQVADRRASAAASRCLARVPATGTDTGAGVPDRRPHGGGRGISVDLALDAGQSRRILQGVIGRLGLTREQVLTGVFALALARWRRVEEIALDVRTAPPTPRPGVRRTNGRLTDAYPVQLTVDLSLQGLGQLAAVAGPLAASCGRAADGAGFGACRELSANPLLRDVLDAVEPAWARLTLHTGEEPLPEPAPRRPGPAPRHRLEAQARITGGRLHFRLDWAPGLPGASAAQAAALAAQLQDVLREVACALTGPLPCVLPATAQQAALFTGGQAAPGTGRHVEQLVWIWHGPLDLARFTASWQSVFACEAAVRTAFIGGGEPKLIVHSRVTPEISRRTYRREDWSDFLERDRLRGFDLRCPGPLRITLLQPAPAPSGQNPDTTRIVLTYHRALLDNWSAHLLLRMFHRAYLAGGTVPGGERRPDVRDYSWWVNAQDPQPAREFWARTAPPRAAAARPARPGAATRASGAGRTRLHLDRTQTHRLVHWAGTFGTTESSALQAVWAMLIHRASGAAGPAPVCFDAAVTGRGIALHDVSRIPGALRNHLPLAVQVDPEASLPGLLRDLRDRALDLAGCEWLPADALRTPGRHQSTQTAVVFEDPPDPVAGLESDLAAHGIRAEFPGTVPARGGPPLELLARHDRSGSLALTMTYDRAVFGETAAQQLLVQTSLLLTELPLHTDESTTIAQALHFLNGMPVPDMAPCSGPGEVLRTLRAARDEQAGTICLLPPPGAPATCYDLLARAYDGPEELLAVTATADATAAGRALNARGHPRALLLAGFSGAGALACDLARRLAGGARRAPRVVLVGACTDPDTRAHSLARALRDAAARERA
ncbi:condensation domain-containing protein [Streptomyces sp. NPDC059063]|uniref:condensation domain-containing protein n=1 Tax=unclassified Streptomyces TaxID=2593676 RepID=UPI0036C3DA77